MRTNPVGTHPGSTTRVGVHTTATVVVGLVGLAFFALSFAYDWTLADGSIGPAALPRTAAALLVAISALRLVLEARNPPPAPEAMTPAARRKLLLVCATVLVTALAIPYLGLLVSLGLMTLFLAAVVERQPVLRSLAVAAGTLLVSYLVFVVVLRIPLPLGLFDPMLWGA